MGTNRAGISRSAGVSLRSVPLVLVAATLILLLTGWYASGVADATRVDAERAMHPYQASLTTVLANRVAMLEALAQQTRARLPRDPDQVEFEAFAAGLRARAGDVRSFQLAPDAVVTYVFPLEGNEEAVGHDLAADMRPEVRADVMRALSGSAPVVSGPYELRQGGAGVVVRVAVRDATGDPWGLAIMVLDVPELVERAGLASANGEYSFALRDADGRVFFGESDVFAERPVLTSVQFASDTWEIGAVPKKGWPGILSAETAPLWSLGIAVALLLAAHAVSGRRYQSRLAAEVEQRTADLVTLTCELEREAEERATATESLRGSEERFRRLFEQSPQPMVAAQDGLIIDANAAFASLLGYPSPADLIGLAVPDVVAPEERAPIVDRMRRRLAGESVPSDYELLGQARDGSLLPVQLKVIVIDTTEGPMIIALATDLRERIEREHLIAESEALFRSLFERSPLPLMEEDFSVAKQWVDSLGMDSQALSEFLERNPEAVVEGARGMRVVRANAATLDLVGVSQEHVLFGTLEPYAVGPGEAIFREELVAIAAGEQRFEGRANLRFGDGLRDALLYWNVAPGFEETYGRVFVSLADVTELRRAQDELERYKAGLEDLVEARTSELRLANERLVEAQAAKDKFLAAMSHELRTPLNSIIGFSSVMLQGLAGDLSEEQRRQTEMVLASGKHLLGLINQVLDLSRVAAGAIQPESADVDLGRLLDAIVANAQELSRRTGLEFRHSLIGACPVSIRSDEMRIRQVILNLLSNAFKFTHEGHIVFDVHCEADTVMFLVSDTGEGLTPEAIEHVFEPFYQVRDGIGDRSEGAGLGLSISHEMAELLGGTLSVESEPGRGSTFTFTLPLRHV